MLFIKHDNGKVTSTHYMPFDEKHGLGKTKEELELEGILVDSIPKPLQQEDKQAVMHVNPTTKEIYYEYEDIPKTEEQIRQEKIIILEQQIEQQNKAIADLTMLIASTQTPSI